jgi:hypothetical protein
VNRSRLSIAAAILALILGWSMLGSMGQDVVTLRTFNVKGLDRYTTLWSFVDGRFVWIRANRADRTWLADLRENPKVELQRGGRTSNYTAALFDRARSTDFVEAGFRKKYGLADEWRRWTDGDETVMVRLVPR